MTNCLFIIKENEYNVRYSLLQQLYQLNREMSLIEKDSQHVSVSILITVRFSKSLIHAGFIDEVKDHTAATIYEFIGVGIVQALVSIIIIIISLICNHLEDYKGIGNINKINNKYTRVIQ